MSSSHSDRVEYETYETEADVENGLEKGKKPAPGIKKGMLLIWAWRTSTTILLLLLLIWLWLPETAKEDLPLGTTSKTTIESTTQNQEFNPCRGYDIFFAICMLFFSLANEPY